MRFHSEKKHIIDFVFPIALFFVFAASSLVVILLAANIYSSTTKSSESGFETRTILSYMTEKIRQGDEKKAVSIETFDGHDALAIQSIYGEDQIYMTYIYEDKGILRELFIQDGVDAKASSGKEIMKVSDFCMKKLSDTLFEFSCSSEDGETVKTIVSVRSGKEKAYE